MSNWNEDWRDCARCDLCRSRRSVCVGKWNPKGKIIIIGEAPGIEEDVTGISFIGGAGGILNSVLSNIGIDKEGDLYLTDVVKCRPPLSRRPKEEEVMACLPYLKEQIAYMEPKHIITLGKIASAACLNNSLKGALSSWIGKNPYMYRQKGIKPIPLSIHYHPNYIEMSRSKHREWVRELSKTIKGVL